MKNELQECLQDHIITTSDVYLNFCANECSNLTFQLYVTRNRWCVIEDLVNEEFAKSLDLQIVTTMKDKRS
mgnify:CR=1 FL=1